MNNEEKILEMLEGLTKAVAQHGEQLGRQAEQLGRQAEQLAELNSRMDRMENRMEEIDERSKRTAVILESDIAPKVQLLFDGHDELRRKMDTLATKEQVEELAEDVVIIKDVVRRHSGDISELKKAL